MTGEPGPRRTRNVSPRRLLLFAIALLIPASSARAPGPHTVQPGQTPWPISAANTRTARTVAPCSGRSEGSPVIPAPPIMGPDPVGGCAAPQQAGIVPPDPAQAAAP